MSETGGVKTREHILSVEESEGKEFLPPGICDIAQRSNCAIFIALLPGFA
ncbi:hypothetical protein ACTJJ8_09805 [Agrobacterium radiobacter]|nr:MULTISPECIES: hypothetical protein [Hyphomicrobiales]UNZ52594.1 hypothetical protein MLE07_17570 [Agrobacterium tumefaciens]